MQLVRREQHTLHEMGQLTPVIHLTIVSSAVPTSPKRLVAVRILALI